MRILTTRRYEKAFERLPKEIQDLADKKIALLVKNPRHPSLRVKKIGGTKGIWESSITMNYRVTFEILEGEYLLRNIGSHDPTLGRP